LRRVSILDDIHNFIDKQVRLIIILVFLARIEYKANPLKRLNFLFGFQRITTKNGRNQRHFIQILSKNVVVFVVIYNHIDNLHPAMEGPARTYEEVIFVEYLQNVAFELF
jgi:hypothetical protein